MKTPLLKSYQIPNTLWRRPVPGVRHSRELLVLPPMLVKVYRELLSERGLRQSAEDQEPNDEGPQGGRTVKATNEHFARNFSGSSARVQLVTLDPMNAFGTTRDALVRLFAGGDLSLLDIPCGTGAASATLLGLVAELRRQTVLPCQPLRVAVLGGDISAPARSLKRKFFEKLIPRLRDFGIDVKVSIRIWDVEDEDQTTELVSAWMALQEGNCGKGVLAANFSGFLHNKVKHCATALREILRYARVREATVFWVEPQTNEALTGLFPGLFKHVLPRVLKLRVRWGNGSPRKAECRVVHPVQSRGRFTARAAALHLESAKRSQG